jgi:hypothetical protein
MRMGWLVGWSFFLPSLWVGEECCGLDCEEPLRGVWGDGGKMGLLVG